MEIIEYKLKKSNRLIKLIKEDSHFTKWVIEANNLQHNYYHLNKIHKYLGGTVIDCGANVGTMTDFYAVYSEKVIAIEPFLPAFECLEYNMSGYNNVTCINAAVGEKKGKCSIECPGNNVGMSFTNKAIKGASDNIKVITIDSLELENVKYIKMDIEGKELEALKGAYETIQKYKPILDIEVNDATLERYNLTDKDIYDYIESIGYHVIDRVGSKPQVDIICKSKF